MSGGWGRFIESTRFAGIRSTLREPQSERCEFQSYMEGKGTGGAISLHPVLNSNAERSTSDDRFERPSISTPTTSLAAL